MNKEDQVKVILMNDEDYATTPYSNEIGTGGVGGGGSGSSCCCFLCCCWGSNNNNN